MRPDDFEALMLICFGLAWPLSIYKTWEMKTSKGKSLFFLAVILIGYISGILFEVFGKLNDVLTLTSDCDSCTLRFNILSSKIYRRREIYESV